MGCPHSKPAPPANFDVFAAPGRQHTRYLGGGGGGGSSSTFATDTDDPETNPHSLFDEYAFNELEKSVFKAGTDCVTDDDAGLICGRVSGVQIHEGPLEQKWLTVSLVVIKSNGKVFFRAQVQSHICFFAGKKKLAELRVRPVMMEEKSKLKERGRLFSELGLGAHFMICKDKMYLRGGLGTRQFSAEGRVMVDSASFLHFNPDYSSLSNARRLHRIDDFDDMITGRLATSGTTSIDIPESSLHLCWPTLCGFSLKAKRWGEISVGDLERIQFSDDAFSQLVLDPESKGMVKSLVESSHKSASFTDVIQGKGGGCVFLLHGPPGTGKTLTAEAVSEILHRPLYCIDVGELGVTPEALEERLKRILEVAERWDAVVLIDECDIFLASRDKHDVQRNAMVGIFLRLLEYYNGVLFLTSNRADDLDAAFQSRISISLEYNGLDEKCRKQVWANLLNAAGIAFDGDVGNLAAYELNGRQIKTAIRLALSLAQTAEEPVCLEHLMRTISYADYKPSKEN